MEYEDQPGEYEHTDRRSGKLLEKAFPEKYDGKQYVIFDKEIPRKEVVPVLTDVLNEKIQ